MSFSEGLMIGAAQDLNAPIPGNRTVVFEACLHQVLKILFSLLGGGYSTPDPGNHRCSFLLLCESFFKLSFSLFCNEER